MASPINTIGQLVSVIQGHLSSRPELASAGKRSSNQPAKKSNTSNTYSSDNLASLIGLRVKSIAPDDPQRGRKAFRIFLESILLSHFGEHLINDPKLYQLIEDIQLAMEKDPETSKLVDRAIGHLYTATH